MSGCTSRTCGTMACRSGSPGFITFRPGRDVAGRTGEIARGAVPEDRRSPQGGEIEIWGDGKQTRSFLYIDECVKAVRRLMASDFTGPVNVGSEEMVSINRLAGIDHGHRGKEARHSPHSRADGGARTKFRQRSNTGAARLGPGRPLRRAWRRPMTGLPIRSQRRARYQSRSPANQRWKPLFILGSSLDPCSYSCFCSGAIPRKPHISLRRRGSGLFGDWRIRNRRGDLPLLRRRRMRRSDCRRCNYSRQKREVTGQRLLAGPQSVRTGGDELSSGSAGLRLETRWQRRQGDGLLRYPGYGVQRLSPGVSHKRRAPGYLALRSVIRPCSSGCCRWLGVLPTPEVFTGDFRTIVRVLTSSYAMVMALAFIAVLANQIIRGLQATGLLTAGIFGLFVLALQHRSVWTASVVGVAWLAFRTFRLANRRWIRSHWLQCP